MNKTRIGIVGGGWILDWHASALLSIQDKCQVVAVAEIAESKSSRIWKLLQNPELPIYLDYEKMYDECDLDAVFILLPHHLHKDATIKAAAHGYHVLCEKPMARNIYECQEMIDACKKADVQLGICYDRRFSNDWIAMKKVVDSGILGRIEYAHLEDNGDSFAKGTWCYDIDTIGGGAMASCMTHQVDGLRWLCGEPETVYAVHHILPERMEGDCAGFVTMRMKSGAFGTVNINWMTQIGGVYSNINNRLWYELNHICGEKGDIYYIHRYGTWLKLRGKCDIPEYEMATHGHFAQISAYHEDSGHMGLVRNFIQMLRSEPHEFTTFGEDAKKTIEVAEAAYISAETHNEIMLPIEARPWEERLYLRK